MSNHNSSKWWEYLNPIFGAATVAMLAFLIALYSADEDKVYCDYFKANAPKEYNSVMQTNEFIRNSCCRFNNHKDHPSCSTP